MFSSCSLIFQQPALECLCVLPSEFQHTKQFLIVQVTCYITLTFPLEDLSILMIGLMYKNEKSKSIRPTLSLKMLLLLIPSTLRL